MIQIDQSQVLVIGLGASGLAAARLLQERGARRIVAVDQACQDRLAATAQSLRNSHITVHLNTFQVPAEPFDFAILSPGVPSRTGLAQQARDRHIPVYGELELGFQSYGPCPIIAITGTNGKTTTTELMELVLQKADKRTVAAGNIGLPLCELARTQPGLDVLTLEVSSFQLETTDLFCPQIAVILNFTPDHFDRYSGMEDYVRTKARLCAKQHASDWLVIQHEALQQLELLNVPLEAQRITFSVQNTQADYFLSGLKIFRRQGTDVQMVLSMDQTLLRGPHNSENIMAVLAAGETMRLPRPVILRALAEYKPAAHRCELVAVANGVSFYNDSKATNVDAVVKALITMPMGPKGEHNVWLIAGGKDKGFSYEAAGPWLSRRVKGAFLIGETRDTLHTAWSHFAPCRRAQTLIEAVYETARRAVPGDVILLSPACSSFDMFQNYQHRGEVFRSAVQDYLKACSSTHATGDTNHRPGLNVQHRNDFERHKPVSLQEPGLNPFNAEQLTGASSRITPQ